MLNTDGSSVFQSLDTPNMVDSIIEQFQLALVRGQLQPGQRLPSEAVFCRQLGVGRSTLREALKALAAIGVVEVRRGDGTYISEQVTPGAILPLLFAILLDSNSPTHFQEFRFIFDSGTLKLAAMKAGEQDIANIDEQIQKMERYIAAGSSDPEELARLDIDFHIAVMEATKNPLIIRIGKLLVTMLMESIKRTMACDGAAEWTVQRHRILLDIIRRRDPSQIEFAMRESGKGLRKIVERATNSVAQTSGRP